MRFGIGFAVLILIHEMGHYVDIKRRGLAGGDAGNAYDFSKDLSTIVYARPGGHPSRETEFCWVSRSYGIISRLIVNGLRFTCVPITISVSRSASPEYVPRFLDEERASRTQADLDSFAWLFALVSIRYPPRLGSPSWNVETCKVLILKRKEVHSPQRSSCSASCTASNLGPPVLQLFTILCDCLTYLVLLAFIVSLGYELSVPVGEDSNGQEVAIDGPHANASYAGAGHCPPCGSVDGL
jgi:hypothetical protein